MLLTQKSIKDIAEELGMTYGTIRKHSENLYKRLGIHSRNELIALVSEQSLRSQPTSQ